MIKLEKTVKPSPDQWDAVIRGMRNAMNSWDRMDSFVCREDDDNIETCHNCPKWNFCDVTDKDDRYILGPNDKGLMMRLAKGGPVHAKYRRMITVYVDITAPLYWWKEFDTYRVGVYENPTEIEMNSCSTMHKIHAKEFTRDDFSIEDLFGEGVVPDHVDENPYDIMDLTIGCLNYLREEYLNTKNKIYWRNMIQTLPSSYNQKRTLMLNYEVLNNIYHSRKNHKLDEWREVCKWIEGLPHSEIIIGEKKNDQKESEQ